MSELSRLHEAIDTLLPYASQHANFESHVEELDIFGVNVENMPIEERKRVLGLGLYLLKGNPYGIFFWGTVEQREDDDYASFDENLKVIRKGDNYE